MGTGSSGWGLSRRARAFALAIALALAATVGCFQSKHVPPESVAGKVWLNSGSPNDYHSDAADAVSGLALAMQGEAPDGPADRPLNVLCVSGGGKYAAFTAG